MSLRARFGWVGCILTLLVTMIGAPAAHASEVPGTHYNSGTYSDYAVDCSTPQGVPTNDQDSTHSQSVIAQRWITRVQAWLKQPYGPGAASRGRKLSALYLQAHDVGTGYIGVAAIYLQGTSPGVEDTDPCSRDIRIAAPWEPTDTSWNSSNGAYNYHTSHYRCNADGSSTYLRSTFGAWSDAMSSMTSILRHQYVHDFAYSALWLSRPGHVAWHIGVTAPACPKPKPAVLTVVKIDGPGLGGTAPGPHPCRLGVIGYR